MKLLYPIVAMLCITACLLYAIHFGRDGVALAGGLIILAGLGGYYAPHRQKTPPK